MRNPLTQAFNAKGFPALLTRLRSLTRRYGPTPARMLQILDRFADTLRPFDCPATFPITAAVVERHPELLQKYQAQGIEFAIHGYTHVDYARLSPAIQQEHLHRARRVFQRAGLPAAGFRSPYLQFNDSLHQALEAAGFAYVSNQPVIWNGLNLDAFPTPARERYQRAIAFYRPLRGEEQPALPRLRGSLVEIPVSLPDDEMLIDRLNGSAQTAAQAWQHILTETHRRGELFTLQLHPERIDPCTDALAAVLTQARALSPPVWCARLGEIAAWWRARAQATVRIEDTRNGRLHLQFSGPEGTTVLVRGVEVDAPSQPWAHGYRQVQAADFTVHSPVRPVIGLSPASTALAEFLRQQDYIVEIGRREGPYAYFFDHPHFSAEQALGVLEEIENDDQPLIRMRRWPHGARSALAVTGDIDALTLWDYGLRLLGR